MQQRGKYVVIVIGALVIGVGVGFVYGTHPISRAVDEKDAEIALLQSEVSALRDQLAQATSTRTTSAQPVQPAISMFLSPRAGERLCRNTVRTISWRADAVRVDEIRITLVDVPIPIAPLVDAPVSWNETGEIGFGTIEWKVGAGSFVLMNPGGTGSQVVDIPDGELYRIRLEAIKGARVIETKNAGPFAIETCEG